MSTVEDDLFPPPDRDAVDIVLTGPVDQVARVRAWIEARAGDGSSMLDDRPDGLVRCRMRVVAPPELDAT
ncbi:hypothetical protein OIE69_43535 (plasmid) [Actinacidiphila glaucinigra]|uniref:hypothetical protein n=1 Tax=Actinacidiphila glaucinigra TaxID=235986 RepID=UPI002DD8F385|nr:hypothetical protein [Actinacidiphila glaucinigra]WSD65782.1 hypothetical protein OIE69_43535 [Actinacidiphila glaucinigra]